MSSKYDSNDLFAYLMDECDHDSHFKISEELLTNLQLRHELELLKKIDHAVKSLPNRAFQIQRGHKFRPIFAFSGIAVVIVIAFVSGLVAQKRFSVIDYSTEVKPNMIKLSGPMEESGKAFFASM